MKIVGCDSWMIRARFKRLMHNSTTRRQVSVVLFFMVVLVCYLCGSCCGVFPAVLVDCELPTSATPDVIASNADTTAEPYRMVVIGDSIAWGNGLAKEDKAWWIVADAISSRTQLPVDIQVLAYTGAKIVRDEEGPCEDRSIGKNETGEVPSFEPSIMEQVALIDEPDQQDLVLVTGCINDVGIKNIIDPSTDETQLPEFEDVVRTACYDNMLLLLQNLKQTTPNARIILSGYYPILSDQSFGPANVAFLDDLLLVNNVEFVGDILAKKDILVTLSARFDSVSRQSQQQAVNEINTNRTEGDPIVVLGSPVYQAEHAIFSGSSSRLFGLGTDSFIPRLDRFAQRNNISLFPVDDFSECRFLKCTAELCFSCVERNISCIWNSVAHPNIEGALAYADAMIAAWDSANESE